MAHPLNYLIFTLFSFIFLHPGLLAMDNLRVAFQWRELDFEYPSQEARLEALQSGEFVPENALPLGLEVYKDRVFITVPRWKTGVPASLTWINVTDPVDSPKLRPYPSWEAHSLSLNSTPEIVSPFRIRADNCSRLWVLDTGLVDMLGEGKNLTATRLLIYDLEDDHLLRNYQLPENQLDRESLLANIAVEDTDCEDSYAYLGDLGKPSLVVYSWKKKTSWRVSHHFFHIDPLAGEFNVDGINFVWTDGLFGLSLSKPDNEGFGTLYFHPLCSTNEFAVSTKYLRDEDLANNKSTYFSYKLLGSRGPKGQSGASFLHKKTNVLFYSLINLNAVACWRTTNPNYTMESQGRIFMSNVSMVFPNDVKVDYEDNLWVLSDRLPKFMYHHLDRDDINFRILTAPVAEAIKGTACDSKLVVSPKMMEKLKPIVPSKDNKTVKTGAANAQQTLSLTIFIVSTFLFWL